MAYLNLDMDYFDHPKTLQLVAILGNGADTLPLRLWAYAGKFHAKNGALGRRSVSDLEGLIRWWGEPGHAVRALQRVGFIGRGRDGFFIHDWRKHQGHIQALKERNKKAAVNRWRNLRGKCEKTGSPVDTTGVPKSTSGMPLAVPFRSVPEQHEKKVDRERTENNNDVKALIADLVEKKQITAPEGFNDI